jgi:hypothetical protein
MNFKKLTTKLIRSTAIGLFVMTSLVMATPSVLAQTPDKYMPSSTYMSPTKDAPIVFTGLGVRWHQVQPEGTSAELWVRTQSNNNWSQWFQMHGDIDGEVNADPEYPSSFMALNQSNKLQYKVVLSTTNSNTTPVIENIEFTYLNAEDTINSPESIYANIGSVSTVNDNATLSAASIGTASVLVAGSTTTSTKVARTKTDTTKTTPLKIISRSDWGADESLRLYTDDRPEPKLIAENPDFKKKFADELKISRKVTADSDGKLYTWPQEYPEKISKIIIHHTATTTDLDNPKAAIRNIYYFHTITRGWGDIGYNYIIDPEGNIYEGRAGGEMVVGAHAGEANVGSIGISVLGNYQDNEVPQPVVDSLTKLIKAKTELYNIDPTGTSEFRGVERENIFGHRDVMSTSCPGDKLYSLIPLIRSAVKEGFKPKVTDNRTSTDAKNYDFSVTKNPEKVSFTPGSTQKITLTLKNKGTKSWGKETTLVVNRDSTVQNLLVSDKLITSKPLGKTVKKGESATFSIDVKAGYKGGVGMFDVFPLVDGKTKVEKYLSIPFQVETAKYDYEVTKVSVKKSNLKKGEETDVSVVMKNTGNVTWVKEGTNKMMLGTEQPRDRVSMLLGRPSTRFAGLDKSEVKPGATATFNFKIKAPKTEGTYREYFAPVIEGQTWLTNKNKYFEIYVYDSLYSAKFLSNNSVYALPGETKKLTFEFQNLGGATWTKSGKDKLEVEVGTEKSIKVKDVKIEQSQVLPGQTAKVTVSIATPSKEGTYKLLLTPKLGSNKLVKEGQQVTVLVSKNPKSEQNPVTTGTVDQTIRVAISFTGDPIISADGNFSVYDGATNLANFLKNEKITVTYEGGKFKVKGNKVAFALSNAPKFVASSGAVLRIDNYEHRPSWNTDYNDNEYLGTLEVQRFNDALVVVNDLKIEDYLKGLAEIDANEPMEKIKSVITLARSYATYYSNMAQKFPGAPYDLTDDPERSQKYLGYGFHKRNPTGVKAVEATTGKIVTYKGKIIKTPYFSSDDGRTRSAQEVWGWTDTPWLVSVKDPGCEGKKMAGHGVGLSGCGAKYLADQGKKYDEIIKYFFKGVELANVADIK